ncbi:MAG: NAD(P)/FAD-dependent oxidoreductase [bacterium]
MSAAINLKKAGFEVEVHEKKSYSGKHTNDFQFLENWTLHEDVLDFLTKINIKTDFYKKEWYALDFLSPSLKKYSGKSPTTLMYLVKRGRAKDSIDTALEKQAQNYRIKIIYNSKLKPHEADIIASGPKTPTWIATGIKFECDCADKSMVLLDHRLSLQAYSYCIVNDRVAEITCCNPFKTKDIKARLAATIKKFESILNIKVNNILERFSASVNFEHLTKAKINSQYFVGEAAGFQDKFAGFGMVYAFKSGYYAAKSLIENLDYDRLWQKDFLKQLNVSATNRMLYGRLSNEGFEKLIDVLNSNNFLVTRLRGGNDLQAILKRLYMNSFSLFLRPLLFWRFGSKMSK